MRVSLFAIAVLAAAGARAAGDAADGYLTQVKPVLGKHCYACHGALKQKAGLRLDTGAAIRHGAKEGAILDLDAPEKSEMLARVASHDQDERMPPEGEPLSAEQIAVLTAWIKAGAPSPTDEQPETDPRDHWAFKAPVQAVPALAAGHSPLANPIDTFLAIEREKRGLVAQPPADPATFARRVYFALTGLPPTREQLDAAMRDPAAAVETLLASPEHAEHWARHWMDVWRYSDWWGLDAQLRNSQKHIWRWRDWIVDSIQADKGYDAMIREMLAGDEIAPNDPQVLRATGFLARNYFLFNRTTWMDSTIEHTAKAFLGLTLNCAKCHDHKFDPLTNADYYRFRAIFEPHQVRLDPVPGETDFDKDGLPRVFDAHPDEPTYLHPRGDDRNPDKSKVFAPGVPELFTFARYEPKPVALPAEAFAPQVRAYVERDFLAKAEREATKTHEALEQARAEVAKAAAAVEPEKPSVPLAPEAKPVNPGAKPLTVAEARANAALAEKSLTVAELRLAALRDAFAAEQARVQATPKAAELGHAAALAEKRAALATAEADLLRAEQMEAGTRAKDPKGKPVADARAVVEKARVAVAEPGETYQVPRVSLKALESPAETEDARFAPYPHASTGRRTALAEWIIHRQNPLTARVAVNHIWMRYFGEPLVPAVFDFGRRSPAPPEQALLDWLAVELMEHGWSMRHIERLIVISQAFRMTSSTEGAAEKNRAADPDNKFLWRMNPVRMESQVVRDSALALAGVLDLTRGGPSIDAAQADTLPRRSLYFFHSANERVKFLNVFDDAEISECYRRQESIVPQQALALSNSHLMLEMARKIAARLAPPAGPDDDAPFIDAAWRTILATAPTADERTECARSLADLRAALEKQSAADAAQRARADFVHALLNHNDFITIR